MKNVCSVLSGDIEFRMRVWKDAAFRMDLFQFWINDTSTLMGHFKSSLRERENGQKNYSMRWNKEKE